MNKGALAEKYRRAYNVHRGYQVRLADGRTWADVEQAIVFYAPVRFVRFEFTGGDAAVVDPMDSVFSRRLASSPGPGPGSSLPRDTGPGGAQRRELLTTVATLAARLQGARGA